MLPFLKSFKDLFVRKDDIWVYDWCFGMAADPSYDLKVSKCEQYKGFELTGFELRKLVIRQLKLKESKCLSLMLANMSTTDAPPSVWLKILHL